LTKKSDEELEVQPNDVYESLFDENNEFTLEGETIYNFLMEVDFSDLFDDEEIRDAGLIDEDEILLMKADDETIETDDEEKADVGVMEVESIDGDVAVELIDMEDLVEMFYWWLENEHPNETLEERASIALFLDTEDGDEDDEDGEVDERFKKGSFRKIRKRKGGVAVVNAMLGAMLNKEIITRAKGGSGKGYKKGDYDKNPKGYKKGGTAAGLRAYGAFLRKHTAQLKKSRKKLATARGVKVSDRIAGTEKLSKAEKKAGAKSKRATASAEAQGEFVKGMRGKSGGATKKAAKKKGSVARAKKRKTTSGGKSKATSKKKSKGAFGESDAATASGFAQNLDEGLARPQAYVNESHKLSSLALQGLGQKPGKKKTEDK